MDHRILGDDDFVDRVLGQKTRRLKPKASVERIVLEICRYFHLEERDFLAAGEDRKLSEARGMATWLVLELGVGTIAELSRRMGRDATTLSAGLKRLQMRARTDYELASTLQSILKAAT